MIVNTISYTGWKLVGGIPDSTFTHGMINVRYFIVMLMLLMVITLVIIYRVVSVRISSPICRLNDSVMGYEAGADDYITKPFSLSVLVLKVNTFFKRKGQGEGEWIDSGRWRFHLGEMCGVKGEERVAFTKNEWKLLRLFLEYPKQILSKTQILEQVFDVDGEFFDENTVAVNIRRLREKIEETDGTPEYIRNVRGLGYLWNKECSRK